MPTNLRDYTAAALFSGEPGVWVQVGPGFLVHELGMVRSEIYTEDCGSSTGTAGMYDPKSYSTRVRCPSSQRTVSFSCSHVGFLSFLTFSFVALRHGNLKKNVK